MLMQAIHVGWQADHPRFHMHFTDLLVQAQTRSNAHLGVNADSGFAHLRAPASAAARAEQPPPDGNATRLGAVPGA